MSIKKLLSQPDQRLKELERLVERQAKQIERLRKPRITPIKGRRTVRGKTRIEIVCGDSHGAYHDPAAVAAFLADVKLLKPSKIVHVGDILDCAGFLSSHGVMGVVPELDYTFEQDVLHANDLLDGLAKAAPGAELTVIDGNHERRLKRELYKWVLRNRNDAEFLLRMFGPEAVLNCEKRGIRYIHRDQYYDGLSISGSVRLEPKAIAQHGEQFCGAQASSRLLKSLGVSVFSGHTHRLDVVYAETAESKVVSVKTGCLCQHRPLYGLTKPTDWCSGYCIRVVSGDGFLAFPVPIISGVSYLNCLAKVMKL